MINYNEYIYDNNEHLYGPGERLLLFCQGCSIRCLGCSNQHMWEFGKGKNITVEELVVLCKNVEGITLLGGEPLDQSDELEKIISTLKKRSKTVILFTGYRRKELKKPSQKKVWELSDLVVSGRFVKSKRNIYLQFRGSTNQRVYRHKGKYKNYSLQDGKTVAVFSLSKSGEIAVRGFCDDALDTAFSEIIK